MDCDHGQGVCETCGGWHDSVRLLKTTKTNHELARKVVAETSAILKRMHTLPPSDLVAKLRKASTTVWVATEEVVANALSLMLRQAADEIQRLEACWNETLQHNRDWQKQVDKIHIKYLKWRERAEKAEKRVENLTQTIRSVLSEEGVKEYLCAYVMGVELINMVEDSQSLPSTKEL